MRVLWFTKTSSLYKSEENINYAGGWIEGLEKAISEKTNINLGISFYHERDKFKLENGKVTYYPILYKKPNLFFRIYYNWFNKEYHKNSLDDYLNIIEDFKPNIIHVFGTESDFGLIQKKTNIPVVIHIQGLLNPIIEAYFPPKFSSLTFLFNPYFLKKNILGNGPYFRFKQLKRLAKQEREILKITKYVMGRTEWDRKITRLFADNKYFHIDELLRSSFFEHIKSDEKKDEISIVSTISPTTYKGLDLIFKVISKVNDFKNIRIRWSIIGISQNDSMVKLFCKKLNIDLGKLPIKFLGLKKPQELINILLNANLFVHPSYIDNSPNSICEAQIIGLPVIACNVGGISSLIVNYKTGILIPSNSPHDLIAHIFEFSENPKKYINIGQNARKTALQRHNVDRVLNSLINSYNQIIQD